MLKDIWNIVNKYFLCLLKSVCIEDLLCGSLCYAWRERMEEEERYILIVKSTDIKVKLSLV